MNRKPHRVVQRLPIGERRRQRTAERVSGGGRIHRIDLRCLHVGHVAVGDEKGSVRAEGHDDDTATEPRRLSCRLLDRAGFP